MDAPSEIRSTLSRTTLAMASATVIRLVVFLLVMVRSLVVDAPTVRTRRPRSRPGNPYASRLHQRGVDGTLAARPGGRGMGRYAGPALETPAVLCDLLDAGLAADPDADALICAEFSWSWRTLDAISRRLAQSYLEIGLRPGDRFASLMPNRPRLIAHYIA